MMIKLIGIDFDETLASTEKYFRQAEQKFFNLVEQAGASEEQLAAIKENMFEIQKRNIPVTGFGCSLGLKAFIDAAAEYVPELVDKNLISGISKIVEEARYSQPEFFDDVKAFMDQASSLGIPLAIITKGELHHQRDKLQALEAYLGNKNWQSFVLGDKTEEEYLNVIHAAGVKPEEFVMIGDSVVSDINPVLNIGGKGMHLSRSAAGEVKWAFEKAQLPKGVIQVTTLTEAADALNALIRAEKPPRQAQNLKR